MHVKENGRDTGRGWGGGAAFEIARDSTLPVNQTRPAQTLNGGADRLLKM